MSATPGSSIRQRRTAEETRAAALAAGRRLLLDEGPRAVTLKGVAGAIGMTHANLLHHFGSAAALQSALMERMLREAVAGIEEAVGRLRRGALSPRELVDHVFDLYGAGGMGRLAAWVASTGEEHRLRPLTDVIAGMVRALQAGVDWGRADPPAARRMVADLTLMLTLAAVGDSLMGGLAHASTGDARDRARELLTEMLVHRRAPARQPSREVG